MSECEFLEVPNFILQKGGVIPMVCLADRTLGNLNRAKDNVVLVILVHGNRQRFGNFHDRCEPGTEPREILYCSDQSSCQWSFIFALEYASTHRSGTFSEDHILRQRAPSVPAH